MAFDPRNPTGGPSIHQKRITASESDPRNPTDGPSLHTEIEADTPFPLLRGHEAAQKSAFFRNYIASTGDLDLALYLNEGNLTQSLRDAGGFSPEDAARISEIAATRGVPEDVVWANKEQEFAWKKADLVAKKLLAEDPVTKLPRYPYTARLAQKSRMLAASVMADQEALTKIEDDIKAMGHEQQLKAAGLILRFASSKGELARAKAIETTKSMVRGTLQAAEIVKALVENTVFYDEPTVHGLVPDYINSVISTGKSLTLEEGEDPLYDLLGEVRKSKFLEPIYIPRTTFLEELSTDIVGAAPQVALGFLGKLPASIIMAGYIMGSTEEELSQLDIDDEGRRRLAGLLNASIQIVPDYVAFGLFGEIGKKGLRSSPGAFAKFMGWGMFSEMTDSYPEYLSVKWGVAEKEGTTVVERANAFWRNFGATTKQGVQEAIILAPGMLIGGTGVLANNIRRNGMLVQNSKNFEQFMKTSEKSTMRKENPEQYVEHVAEMIAEEGVDPDVYVSHDALLQAVDGDRKEVDRLAKELGIEDQLEDAKLLGVDLKIDKAKVSQVIAGTEVGAKVFGDVRFERDGMTLNERAEETKQKVDLIKQIDEAYAELREDNKVPDQILAMREKLMARKREGGFGMSAADADANLVVLMAGAKVLSKQVGETTEQWFNRINPVLEIGGKAVAVEELLKQVAPVGETIEIFHRAGRPGHTVIDPLFQGKGKRGAERKRIFERGVAGPEEGLVEGQVRESAWFVGEPTGEAGLGQEVYRSVVPADKIYDVPEGADFRPADWLAQGYLGFRVGNELRMMVPVDVEHLGKYEMGKTYEPAEVLAQVEEEVVKGAVTFGETQTLINLFEAADASTFSHEASHIFMNDMKSIIDAGLADEQLQADYQTLLDFADGKLDRKGQEKIAVAFEEYLSEGKAPSVGLMSAFRRFATWLKNIYKNIRLNNSVAINDEIRTVFDRMLATEEEIQEAQSIYEGVVELKDAIQLTEKQKQDLAKKKKKVELSAEEKLNKEVNKYLKSYIASKGGKSGINAEAAAEIDAQPVYRAMTVVEEKGGFLAKDVKQIYGEKVYEDLKALGLVKQKGGTTIAEEAANHEFASADAFIKALVEAETRHVAVQMKAKEMIAVAEQNIRSSLGKGGLTAGEVSYHTDARLEFLIAEANLLADEIERREGPEAEAARLKRLEAKVIKEAAEEVLLDKRTSAATRPDRFALAELKFGRMYEKALSEEDLVAAHKARQLQLLHHAMVQISIRMRDEKVAVQKRYRPKRFNGSLKGTDGASAEVATELAYTYGLSNIEPRVKHDLIALEEIDEGLSDGTPEWIKRKVTPKESERRSDHWRTLTMGELLDLDNTIQGVISIGRDKWLAFQDEQHKTPDAARVASIETMGELGTRKFKQETFWERWVKGPLQKLASLGVQVEQMLERVDGYAFRLTGKPGIMRRMFNKIVEQEAYNDEQKKVVLGKAAKHLDALYKAKQRLEEKLGKFFSIEGVRDPGERWTVSKAVTTLAYMGNEKSYNALKNGWGFTDEELHRVANIFTKKEMLAIQGIWDTTNTIFPLLDQVEMNMYSRHLVKEEAQPITLTDTNGEIVELAGGYFPMSQFDYTVSDRAADVKEKMEWADRRSAVHRTTRTRDSARHARVEKHDLPPLLDIRVWTTHLSDVLRTISHSEVMRDFDRVTLNKEWSDKFKEKMGDEAYIQLRDWARFQARPELRDRLPNWVENQRRLAVIAALAYNIKVGIVQRFSITHAARAISPESLMQGWKWIIEGYRQTDLRNSLLGITGASYDEMLKQSPYMRLRRSTVYRDLKEITEGMEPFAKSVEIGGRRFTKKDVQTFGFEFLLMNDRSVVEPIWRGAYSKYVAELATVEMTPDQVQKNAVEYADAIIRQGQPGSAVFDQNAFQRADGWLRLFTNFMSYTSRFGNILITEHQAWVDKKISNEQYFRHVFNDILLSRYMVMLLTSVLTTGGLPEWWDWIVSPVEGLTSWVPVGREITRAAKKGVRGSIADSPVFEGLNRGVEAWESLSDWALDDGQFTNFLWDLGRATEFQLGVKPLGVVEDLDRKYKALSGQKGKKGRRKAKGRQRKAR